MCSIAIVFSLLNLEEWVTLINLDCAMLNYEFESHNCKYMGELAV